MQHSGFGGADNPPNCVNHGLRPNELHGVARVRYDDALALLGLGAMGDGCTTTR